MGDVFVSTIYPVVIILFITVMAALFLSGYLSNSLIRPVNRLADELDLLIARNDTDLRRAGAFCQKAAGTFQDQP
jgi:hypothetical protein